MQELSDAKLKSSETEVDKLQSEIRAKNEELNRLLESVRAVCCKVRLEVTPSFKNRWFDQHKFPKG